MPNPRSAELRQQRRQVITETILVGSRPQDATKPAPHALLRGIRRPDVEGPPVLSDIRPLSGWGTH